MAGVDVPIRVSTEGVDDASDQAGDLGANWDQVGLQGTRAARSLTNGLSGLLSAEQNIYNAQQRVNIAQINYTLTVREYGQGSIQASRALISLQQAQESVRIAQDQLNLRFLQFALTTGPQIYTAISRMIAASMGMTLQNYEETASWEAKAVAIAATMGALTLGLAVFGGLMAGAVTSAGVSSQVNNITQNNSINGAASTNPAALTAVASQQVASAVKSATRP